MAWGGAGWGSGTVSAPQRSLRKTVATTTQHDHPAPPREGHAREV